MSAIEKYKQRKAPLLTVTRVVIPLDRILPAKRWLATTIVRMLSELFLRLVPRALLNVKPSNASGKMALVTVWFLCTPNHYHLDRNLPSGTARMSESHFSESNSSQDNELQFLTDSAFSFLFDDASSNNISKSKWGADGLFMERLESFIEGQLKDIENFANREQVPLEEIRKLVAIPHAKYMLSLDLTFPSMNETSLPNEKKPITSLYTVKSTLARLSNVLQSMYSATGLDSLLLVVSPHTAQNQSKNTMPEASWIGGTEVGKEFWMSLKGGGVNGARAFRLKSQMRYQEELPKSPANDDVESFVNIPDNTPTNSKPPSTVSLRSGDVKTELNAAVRQALRAASGNPSAEMRWTKPAALEELYGVHLVGWPTTLKTRNPSNNSVKENRLLLDLLRSNQMKFVPTGSSQLSAEQLISPSSMASASTASTSKRQISEETNVPEFGEPSLDTPTNHSLESESTDTTRSGPPTSPSITPPERPQKRMRPTE